mmetsp:Transcript_38217/g.109762  ORF Transcript_38217/g.109762 Transcript_38217/m.109762 type:complete len:215 (-) Transcript_38217:68-712(-)
MVVDENLDITTGSPQQPRKRHIHRAQVIQGWKKHRMSLDIDLLELASKSAHDEVPQNLILTALAIHSHHDVGVWTKPADFTAQYRFESHSFDPKRGAVLAAVVLQIEDRSRGCTPVQQQPPLATARPCHARHKAPVEGRGEPRQRRGVLGVRLEKQGPEAETCCSVRLQPIPLPAAISGANTHEKVLPTVSFSEDPREPGEGEQSRDPKPLRSP